MAYAEFYEQKWAKQPDVSEATKWDVTIKRYQGNAPMVWRVTGFIHLTGLLNAGNNHLQISALDQLGNRMYSPFVWMAWTWEGRNPATEPARPFHLDKPAPEPMGNIGLGAGQKVECKVSGDASDTILGVHTGWDSDGPGNHRFHHSFFVVFQKLPKDWIPPTTPPPTIPPTTPPTNPPPTGSRSYVIDDPLAKITVMVEPKTQP